MPTLQDYVTIHIQYTRDELNQLLTRHIQDYFQNPNLSAILQTNAASNKPCMELKHLNESDKIPFQALIETYEPIRPKTYLETYLPDFRHYWEIDIKLSEDATHNIITNVLPDGFTWESTIIGEQPYAIKEQCQKDVSIQKLPEILKQFPERSR